jgi:pimeloyl-ACP methyl ester carboxylesterase
MTRAPPLLDRRSLLWGTAAFTLAPAAAASDRHLLDPQRVGAYALPPVLQAEVDGGRITYAMQGPEQGPLVLYFHGWGDDYRVVLPLEYPLIDAGFRLLVMHRPGYAGTAQYGRIGSRTVDRRTADGNARTAAGLLDRLLGAGMWRTRVIGTSGGAPAALAFASLYPRQTLALVIQCGVTQPWTDVRYVPQLFHDNYLTAFRQFGWAGDKVSQVIFGLLVKLRENYLKDADKIEALAGGRLAAIRDEPAYGSVIATILREDAGNRSGELSDALNIFFSRTEYLRWQDVKAPVLIIHDPLDPFVPFAHAEEAKRRLPRARLESLQLGGHILWLGRDARAMHEARVAFLRAA